MNSFLQQTAKSILAHSGWKQLRQMTLVLPSRRAGLVLKDELLRLQKEAGEKAVYAPQVQTLDQLIDSLSPLYAEDELNTIARLYRFYRKSQLSNSQCPVTEDEIMPLDLFYGWGRQMLADFTNIDASMSAEQVPSFFSNAISAHDLGQWQLDEETENRLRLLLQPTAGLLTAEDKSIRAQYDALWHSLADIYADLHKELSKAGKGYKGMMARRVVEEWESILPKLEGKHFVFVGFNYLLPIEKQIMSLLRDAGQASFYWDDIRDFKANSKAFYFTELYKKELGSLSEERRWGELREVNLISGASRTAQAQYVNDWLPKHYTERGQRVGVVICDENMLEPIIYALPDLKTLDENGENVSALINVTKGFPLRNTQPFAQVVRAAEQWTDTIDWNALYKVLDEAETNAPMQEDQSTTSTWHDLLQNEALFQVRTCVNKMRRLVNEGIEGVVFTPKLTRMLLRRQMESVTMPFHGEPVTDVQVLGVLETRVLDYDSILLLNVEEGVLPQQQHDCSFIPYYLRKYYHMQTSDERATVYAYNFFRLISRANHVTMLYTPAEANPDSKGLSRFVLQMDASKDEFVIRRSRLVESSRLQSADLIGDTYKRYSGNSISPSAINTYISCPRKFYLQQIEGLRPKQKEEPLFADNVLGSFVHSMLESIYRDECGCDGKHPKQVTAEQILSIVNSPEKMQKALDKAYEDMNDQWHKDYPDDPQPHYIAEQHMLENKAIVRYVSHVLDHDAELAASEGLQIWLLEQKRYLSLDIEGYGTISTGGIIDRLDIVGLGDNVRIRVVDYKSGTYKDKKMESNWDELTSKEEKKYVLQTLIYCAAVEAKWPDKPVAPNLYFCSKPLKSEETQLKIEDAVISNFTDIKENFLTLLKQKIKEILTATDYPQQTQSENCSSFCPFLLLCGRKAKDF
ncbi:MAG: PD-(D/E)XK nuclease family protein [Paludibacteraceae bacterium]|nr:PD-(D/E)XK nuclease family protein [Paludibacteraceae bacterium]